MAKYYHVKTRLTQKVRKGVEAMVPFVAAKFLDQHDNLQAITEQVEKNSTLSLEPYYVTVLHSPRACDVKKIRSAGEECEEMTSTVKQLLEQYGLAVGERLEELILGLVKGVDGMWYCLSCNRGRTSEVEGIVGKGAAKERHYKKLSLQELTERINDHKQIDALPQIRLPEINMRSLPSKDQFPLRIPYSMSMQSLPSTHSRYRSSDYVVEHIDAVATRMDHLRIQSQILKKSFRAKQTGKLSRYSPALLSRVIRKMYETVLRDSRLARFFPDKDRGICK